MKNAFFTFVLSTLFTVTAFSADLYLTVGEAATINAGEPTRVFCGGNSSKPDCEKALSDRGLVYRECRKTDTPLNCFEKHWHFFKREYPTCSIVNCVGACLGAYPISHGMAEYCTEQCSN